MHIVALVSGILGLLSLPLLTVAHSPLPLFLAVAFGLVALVTGALSRTQGAGKAGLILGVLNVVGTGVMVFLFMARAAPHVGPVQTTAPAVDPAPAPAPTPAPAPAR
jgi:hypothetical protein